MKRSIILYLVLGATILISGCDEGDFEGDVSIRGIILFENPAAAILQSDTAKGALVFVEEIDIDDHIRNTFSFISGDGSFNLNFLNENRHKLAVEFQNEGITYSGDTTVQGIANTATPLTIVLTPVEGNFSITGKASFRDLLTWDEEITPARNMRVTLKRGNDEFGPQIAKTTSSDGSFAFRQLSTANFFLEFQIDQPLTESGRSITYKATRTINVADFETDRIELTDVQLEWDRSNTMLKVLTTDNNNVFLPGARVCLYTSELRLLARDSICSGSILSQVSNNQGVALFTDLVAAQYFFDAAIVLGKDTLTTKDADISTNEMITKNDMKRDTIRIE